MIRPCGMPFVLPRLTLALAGGLAGAFVLGWLLPEAWGRFKGMKGKP